MAVGAGVAVDVGVGVAVGTGVADDVDVGMAVGAGVAVSVAVGVDVAVGAGVAVDVSVDAAVGVSVASAPGRTASSLLCSWRLSPPAVAVAVAVPGLLAVGEPAGATGWVAALSRNSQLPASSWK